MKASLIEERVEALDTINLQYGGHSAEEAGRAMCAMEAVAWIAGEPHSDHPQCASPTISTFMRSWNDGLDGPDRDRLLKPYLVRLVGSRGTPEQEKERGLMALDWHNGVMLPAFLDLVEELEPHAEAVRADHLNPDVVRAASNAASNAASGATWDAAPSAAWDAASGAAPGAARAAASNAARAAASNAASCATGDALRLTVNELQVSALDLLDRMLEVTA